MGEIVYAAAMSHVLFPDYYGKNVGPHGRRMVEDLIAVVREMGRELAAARPDALVVIADDHLNVFSFDAIPALCVRIGRSVPRMVQEGAIEFDQALDGLPDRYPVHEDLANRILEQGIEAGFDFAASWSAPLDHAFLSPVTTLCEGPAGAASGPVLGELLRGAPADRASLLRGRAAHRARGRGGPVAGRRHCHRRALPLPRSGLAPGGHLRRGVRPAAHRLDGGGSPRAPPGPSPSRSCTRPARTSS